MSDTPTGTCSLGYLRAHYLSHKKRQDCVGWKMDYYLLEADRDAWKARAEKAEAELSLALGRFQNFDCFICKKPTQSTAGNPMIWSIQLPYRGGNGKTRNYHIGCVVRGLESQSLLPGLEMALGLVENVHYPGTPESPDAVRCESTCELIESILKEAINAATQA